MATPHLARPQERAPAHVRPAATSGREAPNNLNARLTSFVGRAQEVAKVVDYLTGTARLVTLTGTGGVGKTRLAQEAARQLLHADAFADGLWWVDLAAVSDPRRLAQAVGSVLGLQEEPDRSFSEVLPRALRTRRILLVLDNCEHLVQACAELVFEILQACPRVSILATSREPLKVQGEVARQVRPLEWPDTARLPSLERLHDSDAVRLFADRAAAANDSFHVTELNASAVARVCQQLDGIPLALELAAARVPVLSVEQIAARLDDCFRLLADGIRTAPPRQRTLEAAVAWSYDLLAEQEQRLFNRLATFRGGWTLEAAEAICGDPDSELVLDVLGRLVEKSLVVSDDGPNGARWYRMTETIRQFAARRLLDSGDERLLRERHFQWYVQFALEAEQNLRFLPVGWSVRRRWLERLRWEIANLRLAWQWPLNGDGSPRDGLRLGAALFAFFWSGFLNEGSDCLAALLERDRGSAPTGARAWALATASKLAAHYGDIPSAVALAKEYSALPVLLHTPLSTSFVHNSLGIAAIRAGDYAGARAHVLTALAEGRVADDRQAVALFFVYLAGIATAEAHLDEAQDLYRQAAAMGREIDFPPAVGLALAGLARLVHASGERAQARELYQQAQTALQDMGAMPQIAQMLFGLGHLELEDGDWKQAAARFGESLELAASIGDRETVAQALEGLQAVVTRARVTPGEQSTDRLLHDLRASAPEDALGVARRVLDDLAHATASTVVADTSMFTRREQEVVTLLARGASNREIADTLVVAERTAEMHVSNILAKLGLTGRAQVAAWAADQREPAPRAVSAAGAHRDSRT
jgi:non-specific serine/threonine protein kinase